jgi:hypothetical protein
MPTETYLSAAYESRVESLDEKMRDKRYDTYWKVFEQSAEDESEARKARFNHTELRRLEPLLDNPKPVRLGREIINRNEVAEEWYLRLGSFNHLNDAETPLLKAFVRMFEEAKRKKNFVPKDGLDNEFKSIATEILSSRPNRNGANNPSELIRSMSDEPVRAHSAIMASNALLDLVRSTSPEDRNSGLKVYLSMVEQINSELLSGLESDEFKDDSQKQIQSDALKYKYEARYEMSATLWKTGEITEDQYEKHFNLLLAKQLAETLKASSEMTNGDLLEHYFGMLLKYGITASGDENRFLVQAATKRQDQPHDRFNRESESFAIDAVVKDLEGEVPDKFIQLKVSDRWKRRYADGIIVINDILSKASHEYSHREIQESMQQIRGLVQELITGKQYEGRTDLVEDHLRVVDSRLGP